MKDKVKFCPNCKTTKVIMPREDNLIWRCLDCGLELPIFPEKEIKKECFKIKNSLCVTTH